MPSLKDLISDWRNTMTATGRVSGETLDELENHLRENVDQLVRSGMSEPEAFERAVRELGGARTLAAEFQKLDELAELDPWSWWPVKAVIVVAGALVLAVLLIAPARFGSGRSGLLLVTHVFTVTLGYTGTFLIGALGVCFVGQRCFTEFSPWRARSLKRVTFLFGCIAAGLTALGIILGMIWAKAEWGRFWAWDAKEIGALGIITWLMCFLVAHRLRWLPAHGVLVMSIVGNVVVSLGWFGANLMAGSHSYGTAKYSWFLLAAIISNLALFAAGFAPAGCLRPGSRC